MTNYDLIVIGAGSGGLTAAIGAASIGAKTLLIEKEGKLGGDCTYYGCVPSKTLINISQTIKHSGLGELDTLEILKKVQDKVKHFSDGPDSVENIKKHGVEIVMGEATFLDKNTVEVNNPSFAEATAGKARLSAKKFIIATGASPVIPQIPGIEKVQVLTNKNIFTPRQFKSLTIIGAGPIGSELGQALARIGVKINLVQRSNRILNIEDKQASDILQKVFTKEGIKVLTGKSLIKIEQGSQQKTISLKDVETGEVSQIQSDEIILAVGRKPNVSSLNLNRAGVKFTAHGITINNKTQTSNKNIYAIGDVTGGWNFTHFADHQAKVAITNAIFGLKTKYEQEVVPRATFTSPEVASVGINEDYVKKNKLNYLILKKEYSQIDKAVTDSKETGFIKIIVTKGGVIRGAVIVGESASELISEVALAMKNNLKIGKISATIHPYPTFSYGLRSCADIFRARKYTKTKQTIIKKLFRLRG